MNENKYIGMTLREVSQISGINFKGYVVFVLRDEQDDTGRRIGECFHIRHFLDKFPGLAECRVKIAHDFYGETILRVVEVKNENP